jgi:hypothetical protein
LRSCLRIRVAPRQGRPGGRQQKFCPARAGVQRFHLVPVPDEHVPALHGFRSH